MPTPGLRKSSRPPALPVSPPALACVLFSAPSKHCPSPPASRAHAKSRGPAGSLLQALSPPNAPAGRALQLSKRSARCVGRESNPGQLLGRQLCSPLYHQRCTARAAARRRPRARPSTLLPPPPPPHPCPDAPSAGGSAPPPALPAAARRPICASATQQPGSTGVPAPGRRSRALAALRPFAPRRGPRTPPPSPPGGKAGHAARSCQHPAGQSPSPPGAGRRHLPRRQGHTGPTRLHASRRCAAPRRGGVASLGAHCGSHCGRAGRKIRLWSGKAVGSPRRPWLRRGDRAPGDDQGLGLEGCTARGGRRSVDRAPPWAAPRRLAQRRREETKGPWGPGGGPESDRGHQKGCVASPSGNRTPVSRVTGGDTHHYTNEDGGDRPAARPLSGSRAACRRLPLPATGPDPTAHQTSRLSQSGSPRPRQGRGPGGHGKLLARAASCLQRGHSAGRRGPEKAREAARTRWARRRPASGEDRRGWVGAGTPRVRLGPGPGVGEGATGGGARRLGRPPRAGSVAHAHQTAARLPGAAHRASRQGRRGSRRVGSQPGERPRARPGPPSGWPSGLRRCVQVAVSPGGVGSNPTPDKPAFWPARQTRPSSPRHCRSPHTPSPPPAAHTRNLQSFSAHLSSPAGCACSCRFSCLPASPPPLRPPSPIPPLPLPLPRPRSTPPPSAPTHAAPRRAASPPRFASAPTSAW